MRIAAISGSLRRESTNTTVLKAAAALAPDGVEVALFEGLDALPHFNPDLDVDPPPPAVAAMRAQLKAAGAFLICSPEYAHSLPGSLKNALDWMVSSGELSGKPVGIINASTGWMGGTKAQAAIVQVVKAMDAQVPEEALVSIPNVRGKLDAAGRISDAPTAAALRKALEVLARNPQT